MALPLPPRYVYRENKSVQKAVDKAAPNNLRSAGAYVRAIAIKSISTRRPKTETHYEVPASPSGKPPFDHARKQNFRKSILFAVTRDNSTAVVGPKLLRGGMDNIARLHEFGGRKTRLRIDFHLWNDGPNVGEYGMLREKYVTHFDKQFGKAEIHRDPLTGQRVFWVRIRKPWHREISRRLYRRFMKKYARTTTAKYPARPYMAPALKRALPKLADFWAGTVKP